MKWPKWNVDVSTETHMLVDREYYITLRDAGKGLWHYTVCVASENYVTAEFILADTVDQAYQTVLDKVRELFQDQSYRLRDSADRFEKLAGQLEEEL